MKAILQDKKLFLFAAVVLLVGLPALFSIPLRSSKDISGSQGEELSLREAAGQVLLIGFEGKEVSPELFALIAEIQPGGVLLLGRNIENKEQLRKLIAGLQGVSEIPLFIAVDQEGGVISRVPWAESTKQSELQNFSHAFLVGETRSADLQESGVNMNLAPVLDGRNPEDFLFPRSFQTDEAMSLQLAQGLVKGHQEKGVAVVPKHFPGYDTIPFNPESIVIPRVPLIPDTSLFEELFTQVSPLFVMISHVVFEDLDPQNPFPFSEKGIAFLKTKLGDGPLIVSDDLLSKAIRESYSLSDISKNALKAGVDLLITAGYPETDPILPFYQELLLEAQKSPELQKKVREAAFRVLEKKKELMIY